MGATINAPIVSKDTPVELQQNLQTLYENQSVVNITTTAPNGSRQGKVGEVIVYNNSGTYENWVNTDGVTAWSKSSGISSETDPQVGAVTTTNVCQGDGDSVECNLTEDDTGACAAGAVCLGGHTHTGSGIQDSNMAGDHSISNGIAVAGTYEDVPGISVSITLSTTGTIVASFSGYAISTQPANASYRIIYDSTAIATQGNINFSSGITFGLGGKVSSVASGTYTVKLQVKSADSTAVHTTGGALMVIAY